MYKSFYSLARVPFSKDLTSTEAFPSSDYQGALGALQYLQKTKGMGLIIGEPGVGKTFTLRSFKESLNPSLYHVVYFPLSTGGVMDFYRGLVYGLGEEPKFRKVDLFRQIQQGIERMAHERKVTPVFILDEMHMAKDAFLQDIALLFNFQMDSQTPFILVLAGLPHLKTRLQLQHNRPLSQRLIMKYEIHSLPKEEVKQYIHHHLTAAGAHLPIFNENALEAIALHSQGWPRAINTLTINSLLFGSRLQKEQITEEEVRLAIEDGGFS
ncbi:AAA family ATPase (plasmid) [Sporosarcina sp. P37]|uniref:ExeA family protein n=1 Tax=unclassified Sporosarcina TaxID=2647733 RepID=UPI000A17C7FF|nr:MULTISPECIES: AAA family ATPase [unclassified Sporosarcina]ARK23667.1 AAA family ATPase [Sporosarcina sp. P37]ARK24105.1 AAA family ATPase [Sporosarcina sp. P37]ARK25520.1 AAA family ATPase [Sporosarcina sp. P37]ARK26416.1 AAA family ATPase [Sporosarcina sp. P37]PID15764.1 AAA family ATPase [Sporosarcina sp. P35]